MEEQSLNRRAVLWRIFLEVFFFTRGSGAQYGILIVCCSHRIAPTQFCTKRLFREGSFWVPPTGSPHNTLLGSWEKSSLYANAKQSTVEQNPPWAGQQNNPHFIVGLFSLQIGTGTNPFIGRLTISIIDKFVNYGLNLWGSIYTPQNNNFGFVECSVFPIYFTRA